MYKRSQTAVTAVVLDIVGETWLSKRGPSDQERNTLVSPGCVVDCVRVVSRRTRLDRDVPWMCSSERLSVGSRRTRLDRDVPWG